MIRRVFLDTMIYLHFRPIDEIDWPNLLACEGVEIIVPQITVHELDKQKNTHPASKVRDRARRTLAKLETWFSEPAYPIRSGTSIRYWNGTAGGDFESLGLDSNWNDDRLIASILRFQLDSGVADALLISDDTGPRLSARAHGIQAQALPEELRLPPEADPIQQQIVELKRQNEKLKSSIPRLQLRLMTPEGNTIFARVQLHSPPVIGNEDDQTLAALKVQYPRLSRDDTVFGAAITPSQQEYDRYNSGLADFFTRYELYLKRLREIDQQRALSFKTVLVLENYGTSPGEDVDIYLHFPDGFTLTDEPVAGEVPDEPTVPVKPRTLFEMSTRHIGRMPDWVRPFEPSLASLIAKGSAPPKNVSRPKISKSSSYDVNMHVQRVKHGDAIPLPTLFVTMPDYERAASFAVSYRLRAANVPEEVSGRLDIIIDKQPHAGTK